MAKSAPNSARPVRRGVLAAAAASALAVVGASSTAGAAEPEPAAAIHVDTAPADPGAVGPDLDARALLDLDACLVELRAAIEDALGGAPERPDLAALNASCRSILATVAAASVSGPVPAATPAPELPVEEPAAE